MGVAQYLRKSRSDDPHEDVQMTIARHKRILNEYAEKHRLPIVAVYEEVVTGDSIFVRPEMMRLLADVEIGKYESVLVVDMDRLGRGGQKDAGIILETFKYSSTTIITPEKTYDLNNEMDEEMAEFKTFMSRREYKMINKRLQRGLAETVKEGGYIANAPYGYTKKVENRRPTLEVNESEAEFVRMMFSMYEHGEGCYKIAETINALGAKPHRADKFQRTSIQRMITNPVYCGKIVWNRTKWTRKGMRGSDKTHRECNPREEWTISRGLHPAVISEQLFDRVQEIYTGRYHPPTNTGEVKNATAGLIVCKKCGEKMQVQKCFKSYGEYSYHRCPTKGCATSVESGLLEKRMLEQLEKALKELNVAMQSAEPLNVSSLAATIKSTERHLTTAIQQKENLYDFLEQGIYTLDVFTERSVALNKKIVALRAFYQAQEAASEKTSKNNRVKEQAERLCTVLNAYATASPAEKNELLKSIVDIITYKNPEGAKKMDFVLEVTLRDNI